MPDTTNRPTPLEVVADAPAGRNWDEESPGLILEALAEHGYVIVHPDDVPKDVEIDTPEDGFFAGYFEGWNACRAHIFGPNA